MAQSARCHQVVVTLRIPLINNNLGALRIMPSRTRGRAGKKQDSASPGFCRPITLRDIVYKIRATWARGLTKFVTLVTNQAQAAYKSYSTLHLLADLTRAKRRNGGNSQPVLFEPTESAGRVNETEKSCRGAGRIPQTQQRANGESEGENIGVFW